MDPRVVRIAHRARATRAGLATLVVVLLAAGVIACSGAEGDGGVGPLPMITGDYALLTVDGANVPTVVFETTFGSETLLSARLEIVGATARDIKQRRSNFFGAPVTITTDTVELLVTRRDERTLLLRAGDLPTVRPDTATLADGVVENGLLTWRTRNAPTSGSPVVQTLVYGRER
jgi:hypothetical protein